MITTSLALAISGTRRCSSREGRATIRNGNAVCGGIPGYMAARSDHSRALPEGSASPSKTLFPASAKTCASQTADVVLPVPGFRLARARRIPVIQAVLQRGPLCGRRSLPCCHPVPAPKHSATAQVRAISATVDTALLQFSPSPPAPAHLPPPRRARCGTGRLRHGPLEPRWLAALARHRDQARQVHAADPEGNSAARLADRDLYNG